MLNLDNDDDIRRELRSIDSCYTDSTDGRFASIAMNFYERDTLEHEANRLDSIMDSLVLRHCFALERFLRQYSTVVEEANTAKSHLFDLQKYLKQAGDDLALTGGTSYTKHIESLHNECSDLSSELSELYAIRDILSSLNLIQERLSSNRILSAAHLLVFKLTEHHDLLIHCSTDLSSLKTTFKELKSSILTSAVTQLSDIVYAGSPFYHSPQLSHLCFNTVINPTFSPASINPNLPSDSKVEHSLLDKEAVDLSSDQFSLDPDEVEGLFCDRLSILLSTIHLLSSTDPSLQKSLPFIIDPLCDFEGRIRDVASETISCTSLTRAVKKLMSILNPSKRSDARSKLFQTSTEFFFNDSSSMSSRVPKSQTSAYSSGQRTSEDFFPKSSFSTSGSITSSRYQTSLFRKSSGVRKRRKNVGNSLFSVFKGFRPCQPEIRLISKAYALLCTKMMYVFKIVSVVFNVLLKDPTVVHQKLVSLWVTLQHHLIKFVAVHCTSEVTDMSSEEGHFRFSFKHAFSECDVSALFEIESNLAMSRLIKTPSAFFLLTLIPQTLRFQQEVMRILDEFKGTSKKDVSLQSFLLSDENIASFRAISRKDAFKKLAKIFDHHFSPFSRFDYDPLVLSFSGPEIELSLNDVFIAPIFSVKDVIFKPLPGHKNPLIRCVFGLAVVITELIADCAKTLTLVKFLPTVFCQVVESSISQIEVYLFHELGTKFENAQVFASTVDSLSWMEEYLRSIIKNISNCSNYFKSAQSMNPKSFHRRGVSAANPYMSPLPPSDVTAPAIVGIPINSLNADLDAFDSLSTIISTAVDMCGQLKKTLLKTLSKMIANQLSNHFDDFVVNQPFNSKWTSGICIDLSEVVASIGLLLSEDLLSGVVLSAVDSLDSLLLNIPITPTLVKKNLPLDVLKGINHLRNTVSGLVLGSEGKVLRSAFVFFSLFEVVVEGDEEKTKRAVSEALSECPLITDGHVAGIFKVLGMKM
ncbi:hypothetical protein GEMRC1_011984 [Eukaryota sp. GEM-RC1]